MGSHPIADIGLQLANIRTVLRGIVLFQILTDALMRFVSKFGRNHYINGHMGLIEHSADEFEVGAKPAVMVGAN